MLTELNARVLGVSADALGRQREFAARMGGLPFALASDASLDVARSYGVVDENERRSRRAIFVVDASSAVMLAIVPFHPGNLSPVEAVLSALGAEL